MTRFLKSNIMESPDHWESYRADWTLAENMTYLNHGSFGPSPRVVQEARQRWSARLESQPMDFFFRQMEQDLEEATECLAEFVGADAQDLVFVDNATTGMNVVAANIALQTGDEVLLTDQEYGAVERIWRCVCERAGAKVVVQKLPFPVTSSDEVVHALLEGVTDQTRLIVVSHITSPTAVILPVDQVCRRAQELGVPVCIDGPHAVAMVPLDLERLGCDFYTASCHKWLCAPFSSGFLYVRRPHQEGFQPAVRSWGTSLGGRPACWKDEFAWIGTRDPASFLSVPEAIHYLQQSGLPSFRKRTHGLAQYARGKIIELTGLEPWIPDSAEWYGSMISLPVPTLPTAPPPGLRDPLQERLWEQYRIEVPVFHWEDKRLLRVSCHLYNNLSDIDLLIDALKKLL